MRCLHEKVFRVLIILLLYLDFGWASNSGVGAQIHVKRRPLIRHLYVILCVTTDHRHLRRDGKSTTLSQKQVLSLRRGTSKDNPSFHPSKEFVPTNNQPIKTAIVLIMSDSDSAWEEKEQGGEEDDSESEEAYEEDEEDEEIVRSKKPQQKAAARKKKLAAKTKQRLKQESTEEQSIKTEDTSSCAVAEDDDKPPISRRPKKRRRIVITQEEIEAESLIPSYARLTAAGGYAATAAHRKKIGLANAGKKPWNKGKQRSQADQDKIKAAVRDRNQRQLLANLSSVNMTEDEYKMYKRKIKVMRENVRKTKLLVKSKLETERAMGKNAKLLAEQEAEEEEEEQDEIIKEEEVDEINQVYVVDKALKEKRIKEEEETKIPAVAEQIPTTSTERVQITQEIEATNAITAAAPATTPTTIHHSVAAASATTTAAATVVASTDESNNVPAAAAAASPSNNVATEDENASLEALLEQRIKYSWTKIWVEASAGEAAPVDDEQQGQGVACQGIETVHEQPTIPNAHTTAGIVKTDRQPAMENDHAVAAADETTTTTTSAGPAPAAPPPKQRQKTFEVETVPEIFRRDFEWSPHERFGFGEESFECPQGGPGGLICCAACTKAYADYLNMTFSDLQSQKINKVAAELETINNFMHDNQERLSKSVTAARRKPPPSSLGET